VRSSGIITFSPAVIGEAPRSLNGSAAQASPLAFDPLFELWRAVVDMEPLQEIAPVQIQSLRPVSRITRLVESADVAPQGFFTDPKLFIGATD
jgi:hypothetical protein